MCLQTWQLFLQCILVFTNWFQVYFNILFLLICSSPLIAVKEFSLSHFFVDVVYCTSAAFMQGYYSTLTSYSDQKYMYTLYSCTVFHNNPWLVSKKSAEEFLLPERVLRGGHGGDERVVAGVRVAVRHQVSGRLRYLEMRMLRFRAVHEHGILYSTISFHFLFSCGFIIPSASGFTWSEKLNYICTYWKPVSWGISRIYTQCFYYYFLYLLFCSLFSFC